MRAALQQQPKNEALKTSEQEFGHPLSPETSEQESGHPLSPIGRRGLFGVPRVDEQRVVTSLPLIGRRGSDASGKGGSLPIPIIGKEDLSASQSDVSPFQLFEPSLLELQRFDSTVTNPISPVKNRSDSGETIANMRSSHWAPEFDDLPSPHHVQDSTPDYNGPMIRF